MSRERDTDRPDTVREFHTSHVVEAVVAAIAEAASTDPLSIDPIFDAVDPDALESLFGPGSRDVTLRFSHEGFTVEVDGGGTIRVVPERGR